MSGEYEKVHAKAYTRNPDGLTGRIEIEYKFREQDYKRVVQDASSDLEVTKDTDFFVHPNDPGTPYKERPKGNVLDSIVYFPIILALIFFSFIVIACISIIISNINENEEKFTKFRETPQGKAWIKNNPRLISKRLMDFHEYMLKNEKN